MLFELIATVALGMGAAGVVMAIRYFSGGRLPGYLVPISAGAAMLLFTVWGEYSWYSRIKSELPDDVQVLSTFEQSIALRPWTLVVPRIHRFSAVNLGSRRQHPDHPDLHMVDVYLVAYRDPTVTVVQIVDCAAPARAEVDGMLTLDAQGAPANAEWVALEPTDPLLIAICET